VPLDPAYHSVLAEDVFAPIDVPSFDRADLDGYAVRAADTYRAREEEPVQLVIAGRIPAGDSHMRCCGRNVFVGVWHDLNITELPINYQKLPNW
jgi:molybdopterin biosynthesis enzyme